MGGEGRQDSNLQGHWIPGQEELQPFSLALWRPPFALQLFHLLTALMLKTYVRHIGEYKHTIIAPMANVKKILHFN